ncbi:unnamed protein product [Lactuca virosa]|uniref:FBD domain-containing protein n=1 Tax=Lactuca virosa TaxID=75947 RepID=A0AAU9NU46_9ASTR|nr:unnamed protein product [Lactuca virosa]
MGRSGTPELSGKLTKLELDNCFFKPPLEFEGFLNLEELLQKDIDFGASLCGTKVNLPQLKKLSLLVCTNVCNFNIKATKLQNLSAYACPGAMSLRLLDSPCLSVAIIAFEKPIEDFVRVGKMNFATMLSNLSRVQYFYIDRHFLKIPKLLPRAISSLRCLWLMDFQVGDVDLLHAALCLLRNSPNLEELSAMHPEMEPRIDVGPASNHLVSPNCLDCTLNRLQTVNIKCFEGSKPELLFIKLLLAHSPSLDKLNITPSEKTDAQKRFDIAKDVIQFPGASPKEKMFYLIPKT